MEIDTCKWLKYFQDWKNIIICNELHEIIHQNLNSVIQTPLIYHWKRRTKKVYGRYIYIYSRIAKKVYVE